MIVHTCVCVCTYVCTHTPIHAETPPKLAVLWQEETAGLRVGTGEYTLYVEVYIKKKKCTEFGDFFKKVDLPQKLALKCPL